MQKYKSKIKCSKESVNGSMRRWADASRFIPIIGQISRLRCAPLEMTVGGLLGRDDGENVELV